jgi:hypothetical protein
MRAGSDAVTGKSAAAWASIAAMSDGFSCVTALQ